MIEFQLYQGPASVKVNFMRIGYFGNPAISVSLLRAIMQERGGEVVFVVSNPDRPQKRSSEPRPTEVSRYLLERQRREPLLLRPARLEDSSLVETLAGLRADIFVVFAFGSILPPAIFSLPPWGTINLHASLLPELRGASPIQSAILQGMNRSGWTVQYIAEKLDAGDVISQIEVPIGVDETSAELTAKMLPYGIELLLKTLEQLSQGRVKAQPQEHAKATFCKTIHREMARIRWSSSAAEVHNFIRALQPRPVAWTHLDGRVLHLHSSRLLEQASKRESPMSTLLAGAAPPGTILASRRPPSLQIYCQDEPLEISELQIEGKKRMSARDFLNGHRFQEMRVV